MAYLIIIGGIMGMIGISFLCACLRDGYLFNILVFTNSREEELVIAAVGYERFKVVETNIKKVYTLKTNNLYNYIDFKKTYSSMVIK